MARRGDLFLMLPRAAICILGAWPSAAWSQQVPSPANSYAPAFIRLVGHDGNGIADPAGRFHVVIRDLANNPIANTVVRVELHGSDLRMASTPALPWLHVDCATRSVWGLTDAQGRLEFAVLGYANNPFGAGPGAAAGGARILEYPPGVPCCGPGGINLISSTVAAADHDGDGLDVLDVSRFLADLGSGIYFGRSDHNQFGTVDVVDLSILMTSLGIGRSTVGMQDLPAGGVCP
jgi:hypothetical protein